MYYNLFATSRPWAWVFRSYVETGHFDDVFHD